MGFELEGSREARADTRTGADTLTPLNQRTKPGAHRPTRCMHPVPWMRSGLGGPMGGRFGGRVRDAKRKPIVASTRAQSRDTNIDLFDRKFGGFERLHHVLHQVRRNGVCIAPTTSRRRRCRVQSVHPSRWTSQKSV